MSAYFLRFMYARVAWNRTVVVVCDEMGFVLFAPDNVAQSHILNPFPIDSIRVGRTKHPNGGDSNEKGGWK